MPSQNCNLCSRTFSCGKLLKRHLQIVHLNYEKYRCFLCATEFGTVWGFVGHLRRSHQPPLKTFDCYICSNTYSTLKYFMIHLRKVHLGQPSFVCQKCNRQFQNHSYLRTHNNNEHNNFCCPWCHKLLSENNFRQHQLKKGGCNLGQPFRSFLRQALTTQRKNWKREKSCLLCLVTFNNEQSLVQHLHTKHFNKCASCQLSLSRRHHVDDYVKSCSCNLSINKCYLCNLSFSISTKRHLHVAHTKNDDFYCRLCGTQYSNRFNQKMHVRRHLKHSQCLVKT